MRTLLTIALAVLCSCEVEAQSIATSTWVQSVAVLKGDSGVAYTTPAGVAATAGGKLDSVHAFNWAYTGSWHRDSLRFVAGTNITLGVNGNTLTISGAAGSGTDTALVVDNTLTRTTAGNVVTFHVDTSAGKIATQSDLLQIGIRENFVRTGANSWFTAAVNATASTTQALTSGHARAYPLLIGRGRTLDSCQIEISTAATGGVRFCIYADNGSVYPGAKVSGSEIYDTCSAAVKPHTYNVTLAANTLYWITVLSNSTATTRAIPMGAIPSVLGWVPPSAANKMATCYDLTVSMGVIPDPYTAGATITANVAEPVLMMRVKSSP